MTYDVYRIIFYSGVALSILFFLLAVTLFFVLRIPAVIGDLTGKTAQKAIENIRAKNEKGGDMAYKKNESIFAMGSNKDGKSDAAAGTGRGHTNGLSWLMSTTKFNTQILASEAKESYETTVLATPGNETTVLDSGNGTTVLGGDAYGTTVLDQGMAVPPVVNEEVFTIEFDITYIHTDEIIA